MVAQVKNYFCSKPISMKTKITLLLLAIISVCSSQAQITASLTVSPGTTVCDNEPVIFTVSIVGCTVTYKVKWIVNGFIQDSCDNCTTWNTTLPTTANQVWCNVNCNPMGNTNSNAIAMTVNPCSGIEEYENGTLLTLYPNPSSGDIIINTEKLRMLPATLSVFDVSGRVVNVNYEIKNHSAVLSTKQFEDGIYYYRITDKDGKKSATGKFIVSK
jgi:hypothetical protein